MAARGQHRKKRLKRAAFLLSWLALGVAVGVALHLRPGGEPGTNLPRSDEPSARAANRPPTPSRLPAERDASTAPGTFAHSYHEGIMRAAPSVVSIYASIEEEIVRDTATSPPASAAGAGVRPRQGDADPGGDPGADPGVDPGGIGASGRRISQGSGVVVDPDGIVLTNLHLVEGAAVINVVLADGTLHLGRLVGSDRETDLAVVRLAASGLTEGLAALPLGDAPPLRVGDIVLAIGNPFGVGQTVTQGIVSATRRRVAGASAWQDFVQIDAAINPGNSGGALINPSGQLVGVTTAVFRGGPAGREPVGGASARERPGPSGRALAEGIGFAIPAELLARVVPEIIADGRVVRGWLGIGADDLPMFPELHRRLDRGAVITAVLPNSPAAAGGLARRDVVTSVDGQDIADATALLLLVSSLDPGTEIPLEVMRGEVRRELSVRLDERPPPDAPTLR